MRPSVQKYSISKVSAKKPPNRYKARKENFHSSNVLIDLVRGVEPLSVKDVTLMHVEGFRKLQHIPSEDLEFIVCLTIKVSTYGQMDMIKL